MCAIGFAFLFFSVKKNIGYSALSPRACVFKVLEDNPGTFFSVKSMKKKIIDQFGLNVSNWLVLRAVEDIIQIKEGQIQERYDRMYRTKIPVYHFSLNTNSQC